MPEGGRTEVLVKSLHRAREFGSTFPFSHMHHMSKSLMPTYSCVKAIAFSLFSSIAAL